MEKSELRNQIDRNFTAPLLVDYVKWILKEATQLNLHTLYFLARDGMILKRIAEELCRIYHLDLECRYLYCSRAALRMPSYHLIGEEAMDLLMVGGYQVTLQSLFQRAALTDGEVRQVMADCNLAAVTETEILTGRKLAACRAVLEKSAVFRRLIREKSEKAYEPAIAYFRQEGLLSQQTVAIVDSGWSGTMQRSLRQLLQSAGFQGKLIGFYFGMFMQPKDSRDGTYLTWLFDAEHHILNRTLLNTHLFECLLSAPHGMTVGYRLDQGGAVPVLMPPDPQSERIAQSIENVVEQICRQEAGTEALELDVRTARRRSRRLIYRYMVRPTPEEVRILGNYAFCDDITEGFHRALADETQIRRLRNHLILPRMLRKMKKNREPVVQLYWPYGTIAFLPKWQQWWYRWNELIWQWLRALQKQ